MTFNIGTAREMFKIKQTNLKITNKMTTPDNTNPETALPVDPAQKAVSNPATQTLFRFVSLRNPQLAKKEGNPKFIFRKENYTGVFDELLAQWPTSGKSKIDFFTEKVKSENFDFRYIKRTEHDIAGWFGNFYISSKNLVANGSLPTDEVVGLVSIITNFNNDEQKRKEVFGGLWDSIIYQVLTQEDFYIKELLTQILQTIHYANNYETFSAESNVKKKLAKQKELSSAKVVIPDYLFVDSAAVPTVQQNQYFTVGSSEVGSNDAIKGINANKVQEQNIESSAATYLPTESVLKRQKVALASYEKSQLEELKKDLLKTKKLYDKQYSQSYDLALQDYEKLVKPIHDNYNAQLLQVEATFTEEMTTAAKKLALSQVVKPEVPEFQFEFRKERDTAFLQKKLSETSLRSFVNAIGEYVPNDNIAGRLTNGEILQENIVKIGDDQFVLPEDENQSFEEMLETIDSKLSKLNDEIYQNTEVEKQEYVSIGGVLIPVNKSENKSLTPFTYNICCLKYLATNGGQRDFNGFELSLHLPDNTWDISEIKHIQYDSLVNSTYDKVVSGNTITLSRLFPFKEGVRNGYSFPLEVHISFSNGKNTQLRIGRLYENTCEKGSFTISGTDNENPDNPENPGNTNTPASTNNTFIPKGFGIKRLGIADYLKVEQTTHAYVEGEVANIENIMAREYRSQSTRRLRRSETTETTSSDTEREKSTDATTSSRFEMQSEVAKILQEATDMGINANTSYSNNTSFGNFSAQLGASYANHRSKEDSMRQAVTQAQEVTARALDRVVTKVHQERVEKMIEEFEENNTHGFDNRKGNQHVVGVYRWVDKLMKNQVWNYGKRMMFEFAIPQPSKLHTLAAASVKKVIEKPVDPRRASEFMLPDFSKISDDTVRFWSGVYNVNIEEKLEPTKFIDHTFSKDNINPETEKRVLGLGGYATNSTDFKIPEGYEVETVTGAFSGREIGQSYQHPAVSVIISGKDALNADNSFNQAVAKAGNKLYVQFLTDKPKEKVSISVSTWDEMAFTINVLAKCVLSEQAKQQYQQKTFKAIIEAYEDALADYNSKLAEEDAKASNIKDGNPMFYRQIEQEVLKHNSIAYLVDDSVSKNNKVLGKSLYSGTTVAGFEVAKTGLDDYASLAKFMEQAFEWDIMSYNYYPYYWGKREDWDDMYQSENIDPLFRSFLRSGMARVVVTVRPGLEDAVQFYMSTGRLWNGGEVPVIGDPMYLSIVDEMKDVKGEAQGKPWITRLPTSLTILQAESIGLKVFSALPFTKEEPELFENPEEVITVSNFINNDAMIESGSDKQVAKIGLDEDALQLTTEDDQVVSELSLDDLKTALE